MSTLSEFFIAYAPSDQAGAKDLIGALRDLNRIVFLDKSGLEPRVTCDNQMIEARSRSQAVVVLESPHTAAADGPRFLSLSFGRSF